MKKQLFLLTVVALSATLLVGCKKNPNGPEDPTAQASLTINPRELVLVLGDNPISLTATITPADATTEAIKWSSSNPSVATVTNRGYVQAVDYGDCYIYATAGELKDSCYIHVQTFLEAAVFNGAIVWDEDTTYLQDEKTGEIPLRTIEASDGTTYQCYVALATLYVFSDGFYIDNAGKFAGTQEGVILELEAPMFYASKYVNHTDNNIVFCLGEWEVTDTAKYVKQCLPSTMDEVKYVAKMKEFIEAYNAGTGSYAPFMQAAAKFINNPTLKSYEYDTDETGEGGYYSSHIPEALCLGAHMSLNNDFAASKYMCGMDYCEVVYQQLAQDTVFGANWGLNIGFDEATEKAFLNDEQVRFNPVTKSVFGNVPGADDADEAPKYKPLNVPVISQDYPEVAARIREQLKGNSNVKLVRKH